MIKPATWSTPITHRIVNTGYCQNLQVNNNYGRMVTRLQLLILIHTPHRNAERPWLHSHAERRERSRGSRKTSVGCQAVIAAMRRPDKPAPTAKTEAYRPLLTTQQAER